MASRRLLLKVEGSIFSSIVYSPFWTLSNIAYTSASEEAHVRWSYVLGYRETGETPCETQHQEQWSSDNHFFQGTTRFDQLENVASSQTSITLKSSLIKKTLQALLCNEYWLQFLMWLTSRSFKTSMKLPQDLMFIGMLEWIYLKEQSVYKCRGFQPAFYNAP